MRDRGESGLARRARLRSDGQSVNLSISLSFVLLSYSLSLSLYLSLSLSLCRFSDADSTCIVFMLVIWLKSHCAQLCAHCLIVLAPLLHL